MLRVPLGTATPVRTVLGSVERAAPSTDGVWIGSDDPLVDVVAAFTDKPSATPPRPRFAAQQRPGQFDLNQYVGHDLYELYLPIKFDDGGASVEKRIRELERLAERSGPNTEPPIVRVQGRGVPHATLRWRVQSIEEDKRRTRHQRDGDRWRYCAIVTLVQHVTDRLLAESLKAVLPAKRSRGVVNRTTRVKAGEDSVYDVSNRVYGDPSRASDIARANPGLRLGSKLRPGAELRLP